MNMVFLGLAAIVLLAGIGTYLYYFIKRIFKTFKAPADKLPVRVIIIVLSVICGVCSVNIFSLPAMIIYHIVALSMAVMLINFIIKKLSKEKYETMNVWRKIYGSGIIAFGITAVIFIYGHYNMMHVVQTDYTIYTDKEIRREGYRAALIADVHFSVSVDLNTLKEKCDEISSNNVDMVFLCGDIVDENTSKENMEQVFKAFSEIKSTYGVYYVYGNHDRQLYRNNRKYTEEELKSVIESFGITILQDEKAEAGDEIVVVGREDASYHQTLGKAEERDSIEELIKDIDKDKFIIVLDHQPKEYEENSMAGTDLILSGHTHAGQMWPVNIAFKFLKFDDAVYGYTKIDATQAFITSGFAGWGYSVKTSSPAEYVIIDIKGK
ncbi:MAG: metallophosphoesterase [Lachnospiraceae bacterium]